MAKQSINIGSAPNDRTGDPLRTAGDKINDNFDEIYTALGDGSVLDTPFDGAYSSLSGAPVLATVATSGAYSDLSGAPTIPADLSDLTDTTNLIPADLSDLTDTTNLLFDGDYNSLSNLPTIPADVSDLTDTTNLLDNSARYTFVSGDGTDYTVSGPGIDSTNQLDPTLIVYRGHTYKFINNATGHPVEFLNSSDNSAIARIISSTGAAANVAQVGETVTFTVPLDAATGNTYLYRCTAHPADMLGTITVA